MKKKWPLKAINHKKRQKRGKKSITLGFAPVKNARVPDNKSAISTSVDSKSDNFRICYNHSAVLIPPQTEQIVRSSSGAPS